MGKPRMAGLVLAVAGPFTHGSTSPFAFVLCAEWLLDPSRAARRRRWDWVGLVLSIPGIAWFALMSVAMWFYDPIGNGTYAVRPLIAGYWCGFGGWLLIRSQTRWRWLREVGAGGRDANPA